MELLKMKVKDVRLLLEKKEQIFENLQNLELKIRNDKNFKDYLNSQCDLSIDVETMIREVRMSFYDKEILRLREILDNVEIPSDIKDKIIGED